MWQVTLQSVSLYLHLFLSFKRLFQWKTKKWRAGTRVSLSSSRSFLWKCKTVTSDTVGSFRLCPCLSFKKHLFWQQNTKIKKCIFAFWSECAHQHPRAACTVLWKIFLHGRRRFLSNTLNGMSSNKNSQFMLVGPVPPRVIHHKTQKNVHSHVASIHWKAFSQRKNHVPSAKPKNRGLLFRLFLMPCAHKTHNSCSWDQSLCESFTSKPRKPHRDEATQIRSPGWKW